MKPLKGILVAAFLLSACGSKEETPATPPPVLTWNETALTATQKETLYGFLAELSKSEDVLFDSNESNPSGVSTGTLKSGSLLANTLKDEKNCAVKFPDPLVVSPRKIESIEGPQCPVVLTQDVDHHVEWTKEDGSPIDAQTIVSKRFYRGSIEMKQHYSTRAVLPVSPSEPVTATTIPDFSFDLADHEASIHYSLTAQGKLLSVGRTSTISGQSKQYGAFKVEESLSTVEGESTSVPSKSVKDPKINTRIEIQVGDLRVEWIGSYEYTSGVRKLRYTVNKEQFRIRALDDFIVHRNPVRFLPSTQDEALLAQKTLDPSKVERFEVGQCSRTGSTIEIRNAYHQSRAQFSFATNNAAQAELNLLASYGVCDKSLLTRCALTDDGFQIVDEGGQSTFIIPPSRSFLDQYTKLLSSGFCTDLKRVLKIEGAAIYIGDYPRATLPKDEERLATLLAILEAKAEQPENQGCEIQGLKLYQDGKDVYMDEDIHLIVQRWLELVKAGKCSVQTF